MQYRELGTTGVQVSEIILGAWQFGVANWTDVEDDMSIKTIHAALDAGINCIDTAVGYGSGHSEEIVGKAVQGRRDEVILASKTGANPDGIRKGIDACLERMRIDFIDLYQVHYPSPQSPIAGGGRYHQSIALQCIGYRVISLAHQGGGRAQILFDQNRLGHDFAGAHLDPTKGNQHEPVSNKLVVKHIQFRQVCPFVIKLSLCQVRLCSHRLRYVAQVILNVQRDLMIVGAHHTHECWLARVCR